MAKVMIMKRRVWIIPRLFIWMASRLLQCLETKLKYVGPLSKTNDIKPGRTKLLTVIHGIRFDAHTALTDIDFNLL